MNKLYKNDMIEQIFIFETWAQMISRGMPIIETIEICGSYFKNYKNKFENMKSSLLDGNSFNDFFEEETTTPFHYLSKHFLSTGESTGTVDTMMERLACFIKLELKNSDKQINQDLMEKMLFYDALSVALDTGLPLFHAIKCASVSLSFPSSDFMADVDKRISRDSANDTDIDQILESLSGNPREKILPFPKTREDKTIKAPDSTSVNDLLSNHAKTFPELVKRSFYLYEKDPENLNTFKSVSDYYLNLIFL